MPVDIDVNETDSYCLEAFQEAFAEVRACPSDEQSLLDAAPALKKLANNQAFLGDFIAARLERYLADPSTPNLTAQVMKVADLANGHFLRAVVWPAEGDEFYRKTGPDLFFYSMPHDHNFHFLTVGYRGPGYVSDYYEVNTDTSAWHPQKEVEVEFVGRRQLEHGKLMLYRAHRDIHSQLPPPATSITVNIIPNAPSTSFTSQHVFEEDTRHVSAVLQDRANSVIFTMASVLGGEAIQDRLLRVYDRHGDDLVRFYALRAAALSRKDKDGMLAVMERGADSDSAFINGWTRTYLAAHA